LPVQLTSFIGREQELAELESLIKTKNHRLITLWGAGGTGKTRLALQIAVGLANSTDFADGVWLIELATVFDEQLLVQTITQTLGIKDKLDRPLLPTLLDYLKPRKLLLIFDTCEHIAPLCAELSLTLLQTCPNLQILATSREILGVGGELVWKTPSLTLPDLQNFSDSTTLVNTSAVKLFVERAKAVQPHFELTDQNIAVIGAICVRLEGIPLALELAAARTKVLSPQQILQRLDRRLPFLITGDRSKASRQHTLKSTIDWSYNLLSVEEKVIFRRLAVFSGGWDLEAAETVCRDSNLLAKNQAADLLQQLLDKSLIVLDTYSAHAQLETRYTMLDTLREYGREALDLEQELEQIEQLHAQYYLKMAEEAEYGLWMGQQKIWLWRLEVERANLWNALNWSKKSLAAKEIGMRIAGALWWFWYIRCCPSEGEKWLSEEMLQYSKSGASSVHIKLINGVGAMYFLRGNFQRAAHLQVEAVNLARQTQDWVSLTFSLGCLAMQKIYLGEFDEAKTLTYESVRLARSLADKRLIMDEIVIRAIAFTYSCDLTETEELLNECLEVSREVNNSQCIAYSLTLIGFNHFWKGNLSEAEIFLESAICICREIDDRRLLCEALNQVGLIYSTRGDYDAAKQYIEESLKLGEEAGNRQTIAVSKQHLGKKALQQADYLTAANLLEESLKLFIQVGDKRGIILVLEDKAEIAHCKGQLSEAAYLLATTIYLRNQISVLRPPSQLQEFERKLEHYQTLFGERFFEEAVQALGNKSFEEVVAEAYNV
jgi:predicted ATPase